MPKDLNRIKDDISVFLVRGICIEKGKNEKLNTKLKKI